jgi:RNA polymerase sigma-70 factor, ECF subfamily
VDPPSENGLREAHAAEVLSTTLRSEAGRILGVLTRVLGSLEDAEDVLQSAGAVALQRWPRTGLPSRPGAWLTTVAKRKAIDLLRSRRREQRLHRRLQKGRIATEDRDPYALLEEWPDERLRLLFFCCHPSLQRQDRLAMTLKEVCGFGILELSRALLISETAARQRLVRAKRYLKESGATFSFPEGSDYERAFSDVLGVIYLMFNEGYLTTAGPALTDSILCRDAIDLGRMLLSVKEAEGRPLSAEHLGVLALMLLIYSRRKARTNTEGFPVILEDQDRSLWDPEVIREGLQLLDRAVALGTPGPYQIKAAINAVHCLAADAGKTDWAQIYALYGRLIDYEATSVVLLNRAVALGMWKGPEAGMTELKRIAEGAGALLENYLYYHMARGRFLADTGNCAGAASAYRRAAELASNPTEERFIRRCLVALQSFRQDVLVSSATKSESSNI